jgi:hypothetical protein
MTTGVSRILLPIVIGAAALWLGLAGSRFVRFHLRETALFRIVQQNVADEAQSEQALAGVRAWQDVPGVRARARILVDVAERKARGLLDPNLESAAAVVSVDPINGWAWLGVARAAIQHADTQDLAYAAFDMSALASPYEYEDMTRRIAFLMDNWNALSGERRNRAARDIGILLSNDPVGAFHRYLATLLAALPAAAREDVRSTVSAYNPGIRLP